MYVIAVQERTTYVYLLLKQLPIYSCGPQRRGRECVCRYSTPNIRDYEYFPIG